MAICHDCFDLMDKTVLDDVCSDRSSKSTRREFVARFGDQLVDGGGNLNWRGGGRQHKTSAFRFHSSGVADLVSTARQDEQRQVVDKRTTDRAVTPLRYHDGDFSHDCVVWGTLDQEYILRRSQIGDAQTGAGSCQSLYIDHVDAIENALH